MFIAVTTIKKELESDRQPLRRSIYLKRPVSLSSAMTPPRWKPYLREDLSPLMKAFPMRAKSATKRFRTSASVRFMNSDAVPLNYLCSIFGNRYCRTSRLMSALTAGAKLAKCTKLLKTCGKLRCSLLQCTYADYARMWQRKTVSGSARERGMKD